MARVGVGVQPLAPPRRVVARGMRGVPRSIPATGGKPAGRNGSAQRVRLRQDRRRRQLQVDARPWPASPGSPSTRCAPPAAPPAARDTRAASRRAVDRPARVRCDQQRSAAGRTHARRGCCRRRARPGRATESCTAGARSDRRSAVVQQDVAQRVPLGVADLRGDPRPGVGLGQPADDQPAHPLLGVGAAHRPPGGTSRRPPGRAGSGCRSRRWRSAGASASTRA